MRSKKRRSRRPSSSHTLSPAAESGSTSWQPAAVPDPALDTPGADLLRLIHSLSHRIIRKISAFAGIEREALSEYLVPLHLGFVVFAASRGDFVLGGLQALFENDLDKALREVVHGEP